MCLSCATAQAMLPDRKQWCAGCMSWHDSNAKRRQCVQCLAEGKEPLDTCSKL